MPKKPVLKSLFLGRVCEIAVFKALYIDNPLVLLFFRYGKIEVDMSVNNPVCIRNTNLLYVYSQMDWRVRPLMTAIKAWAKSKGINEAVNQVWTINSILFGWLFVNKKSLLCLEGKCMTPIVRELYGSLLFLSAT